MALSNEQLILLDNFIYLNDSVSNNTYDSTVKSKVKYLLDLSDKDFKKAVTDGQFFYCGDMVNGMTANQWKNVLNAIAEDETLMNMKITNVKDDNDYTGGNDKTSTGFRAACFTNGNETAVIYRGTVGSFQWDDNGAGGTLTTTTSQKQAYQYLMELQYNDEIKDNSIYVSGHSKGGNMAQFASLIADKNTDLNIERCLSFNGQGFSQQELNYFDENGFLTDEAIEKMCKISSEYDIVHSLFMPIGNDNVKENIIHIKSTGELSFPLDYALVGHIGSNVLTEDGKLNESTNPRPINVFMSEMMVYMYEYVDSEKIDNICQGIMGLLADNQNIISLVVDILIPELFIPVPIPNMSPIVVQNEHQDAISNFGTVLLEFIKDSKNKGLLYWSIVDYLNITDGKLSQNEADLLAAIVDKFDITSDDIKNGYQFYYDYTNNINDESIKYEPLPNETINSLLIAIEFAKLPHTLICTNKKSVISNNTCVSTNLNNVKKSFASARVTKYDPLILDLDGDGFNVEKKELGTNFDLDKNGFAEKINWTKKDGFLCLDLNGNGAIDDGGELFGDQTLLADGTRAKNGFEALAQYDGNFVNIA